MQFRLGLGVVALHAFVCERMEERNHGSLVTYHAQSETHAEHQHTSQSSFMLLKVDLKFKGEVISPSTSA